MTMKVDNKDILLYRYYYKINEKSDFVNLLNKNSNLTYLRVRSSRFDASNFRIIKVIEQKHTINLNDSLVFLGDNTEIKSETYYYKFCFDKDTFDMKNNQTIYYSDNIKKENINLFYEFPDTKDNLKILNCKYLISIENENTQCIAQFNKKNEYGDMFIIFDNATNKNLEISLIEKIEINENKDVFTRNLNDTDLYKENLFTLEPNFENIPNTFYLQIILPSEIKEIKLYYKYKNTGSTFKNCQNSKNQTKDNNKTFYFTLTRNGNENIEFLLIVPNIEIKNGTKFKILITNNDESPKDNNNSNQFNGNTLKYLIIIIAVVVLIIVILIVIFCIKKNKKLDESIKKIESMENINQEMSTQND